MIRFKYILKLKGSGGSYLGVEKDGEERDK